MTLPEFDTECLEMLKEWFRMWLPKALEKRMIEIISSGASSPIEKAKLIFAMMTDLEEMVDKADANIKELFDLFNQCKYILDH